MSINSQKHYKNLAAFEGQCKTWMQEHIKLLKILTLVSQNLHMKTATLTKLKSFRKMSRKLKIKS